MCFYLTYNRGEHWISVKGERDRARFLGTKISENRNKKFLKMRRVRVYGHIVIKIGIKKEHMF